MRKLHIVSNIILFYGNLIYYISLVMYKFCNLIMNYMPDNIVPEFFYKSCNIIGFRFAEFINLF